MKNVPMTTCPTASRRQFAKAASAAALLLAAGCSGGEDAKNTTTSKKEKTGMDFDELKEGLGHWITVSPGIIFFPAPIIGIILQINRIFEPASLIEMMGSGAAYRIVFSCPRNIWKELGDDKAFRGGLDVLPESPPAEIPCLLELLVRAFEHRSVFLQERLGL